MQLVCMAAFLAGCAGPRRTPVEVDPATLSDDAFLHYLADVPVVTVDEAYRAMLILADGEDTTKSFEEREAKLIERGVARRAWGLKRENVIDHGSVAAMVAKVLRLKGGVNRLIFGSMGLGDRRYATRELIYRDMLPEGPDYTAMRGGVMVALVSKADTYMQEHGIYESEKIELGEEEEARRLGGE